MIETLVALNKGKDKYTHKRDEGSGHTAVTREKRMDKINHPGFRVKLGVLRNNVW